MADVVLSERADEWLDKAEPDLKDRVVSKLQDVSDFPEHYLNRLSGSDYYKLRIGQYRAIIDWDKDRDVLLVRRINHRDRVYDS